MKITKQVQCSRCGYIFDSEEEEFGYCPCCENDQVEFQKRNELRVGDVVKFADNYDKPRLWCVEYITKNDTPVGEVLDITFKELEVDCNYSGKRCQRHIHKSKYYN